PRFRAHLAIRRYLRMVSYCSRILCMPRGNPSPKLTITIDPDIHENILAAAARDGVSVSAWMTAAARQALQRRAGLAAVALWEKQHGRFTTEEMNEGRRSVRAQLRTSRTVRRSAWERSSMTRPFSWPQIETSGAPGLNTRPVWNLALFHWFARRWSPRSAGPHNKPN